MKSAPFKPLAPLTPPASASDSPARASTDFPSKPEHTRAECKATSDSAAWVASAVAQFETPLVQYCTRLLRGDVDRARDVVQDAFLKLWSADRSSIESHLGQWLYRVCRNRALDVHKKEQRMTALHDEQLNVRIDAERATKGNSRDAGEVVSESRTSAIFDLLDGLNDAQAEALRLKFQGGLSYKEIATVMDITANHVGVIIHNAIKSLRERATNARTTRGEA